MADDRLASGEMAEADGEANVEADAVGLDASGVVFSGRPPATPPSIPLRPLDCPAPAAADAPTSRAASLIPVMSPGASRAVPCEASERLLTSPTPSSAGSTANDTLLLFFLRAMLAECDDASLAFRLRACPSLLSVSRRELFR